MSFLQATVEHLSHKWFPILIIGFLLWTKFGFASWEAYVILGLIFFIQNYHFKLGYFASILENQGTIYEKKSEMEE
tara:strand:- start:256 stop:483 length:228 start_codon:yes stop_codon:yes gene_type:complete